MPAKFFETVLGPAVKYSCCLWDAPGGRLEHAEQAALRTTCERLGIEDGQRVLDLGCGWGSAALWIARRLPNCSVTAVSNSRLQREFIQARARALDLGNLRAVTAEIGDFHPQERFDRILSIEMFEHLRNHAELMRHIATWLDPSGRLLVQVFCHRRFAYRFETDGAANWRGRHFFTGGTMPSEAYLTKFRDHLECRRTWTWGGRHYRRTAEAWLRNLDRRKGRALAALEPAYGPAEAGRWLRRWRIFFLACTVLWGFRDGKEWYVAQYLFRPKAAADMADGRVPTPGGQHLGA